MHFIRVIIVVAVPFALAAAGCANVEEPFDTSFDFPVEDTMDLADDAAAPDVPRDSDVEDNGGDFVDGGPCTFHSDCDDLLYCNGVEACISGECRPGTPIDCDDGKGCTRDECVEATQDCTHTPDTSVCDDGIDCTDETCDPVTDECISTINNALCDDGVVCNGRDICDLDAGGCVVLEETCDDGNPCTIDSCDDGEDVCVNELIDGDGDTYPPESCGGPDCEDDDPDINPGAEEICDDEIDNNCNDRTDADDYACCEGDNDTCDCPVVVSGGGVFTGTTTDANDDYSGSCGSSGGKDRVFYLHLPIASNVEVSTDGSDFDTILYLREASCADGEEVDCDDDGGSDSGTSQIKMDLFSGDYFIFVDGYGSSEGSFTLSVTISETPPMIEVSGNDTCSGAHEITTTACFAGDTSSMTDDYDGEGCGSGEAKDVVFSMTLAESAVVLLDTSGSGISDTILYVRSGSCTGTELECDDDDGDGAHSYIEKSFTPGTYYIFVDGYNNDDEGPYQLCVTF